MSEKNAFLYGLLKTSNEIFKLTKQRISIGRNKNSQIVISNNTVSKDHAIIEFDEDYNATIKDLNSSNGTYVNGEKLKNLPLKLRTGDKIKFGKYEKEYIFESSNLLNDTKTEPELNNMEINQNVNSIGMNNQIYDSIEMNQVNRNIKDGKISLVNENEISYPKINHFQNKKNILNDFHNSNGMNCNATKNIKQHLLNNDLNQFDNNTNQMYIQDNDNSNKQFDNNKNQMYIPDNNKNQMFIQDDNNLNNNNTLSNNKFFNNNENEEEEIYNNNMNNINSRDNNNFINNSKNNFLMNSEYTFKNKVDDLEKKIENYEKEKDDLNKALNDKINELKQMTNLFDELNVEYSKLNSKHNALMVYASDIQKKLDLQNIEINEYKAKNIISNEKDFNNILTQKNDMISILQNEINFYKELSMRNNNSQTLPQQLYNNDSNTIQLNNKLNTISDIFINENKQLKKKLEIYKNKINTIQKNNNNKNVNYKQDGSGINFAEFETQINYQIDNFNNIISDYNSKLSDALNKITELFENNNKEEAAKYLVEQINEYMLENQKLISENAKLNTQILELQSLLNKEHENLLFSKMKNTSDISLENKTINVSSNSEINTLKNKIGELENIVESMKNAKNNNISKIEDTNLRTAFVNVLNELKTKEITIKELQKQLKDNISRNNMNFDDKEIVSSISKKLKEKDNMIQNLKNKINNNINDEDEGNQKINEIRRRRELFN